MTIFDIILKAIGVKAGQEFLVGDINYRLYPTRLEVKSKYSGWQQENAEVMFRWQLGKQEK